MTNTTDNKVFDRVLIIMFENMYRGYIMQNPYMRDLAAQGINMSNYHGVMHPSQTNYISSIAGELCNVSDDDRPPPLPQRTIVDLIEEKGLIWKAYMDAYNPATLKWSKGFVPQDDFPYLIKHNPFSSFANIIEDKERWQRVVSAHQLYEDAASGNLPEYCWFTPDMWNDGHYSVGTQSGPHERAPALVDQQALWLEYFFGMLKFPGPDSILPDGTLVVVTYDEADFEAEFDPKASKKYTYDGPNQIYTVLLGSMVEKGRVEPGGYNHYSLIRTIEENFNLGTLAKNDQHSNWFQFLWKRHFNWGARQETPFAANGPVAFTCCGGVPILAFRDAEQQLCIARYENTAWSDPEVFPGEGSGDQPFAIAVAGETLHLVVNSPGGIEDYTFDSGHWTRTSLTTSGPVGALALTAFDDGQQLMLAWRSEAKELFSLVNQSGNWSDAPVPIGPAGDPFVTEGSLCLAVLGSSLFCIYEATQSDAMMVVSYNCADFNVITAKESAYSGDYNDTTVNQWSPSAFPVEAFSSAPFQKTPGEPEPQTEEFAGRAPLACATLDGVIHLAHGTPQGSQIVTETMSISGLLTPKLPVSYAVSEEKKTNNGYGTLKEAGWSEQVPIEGAELGLDSALAMASDGQQLWMAYTDPSGSVIIQKGSYQQE